MANVNINMTGRDNVSPQLQQATQRLIELHRQIDVLKSKGAIGLTVADASNLNRLTGQANRLERALMGVGASGTQAAGSLTNSFRGLQSVLGGIGLGGLGSMLGGAGLAMAAVGAGKLAFELNKLGEVNREIGIRFQAFAGSAAEATRMIQEMSRAAEGGVDDEELMRSATLLLSTDLINTAEQMGSVTRSALLLGNALDSPTARIEAFTNAMMTGSSRALRQFGITTGEVDAKIQELTASSAGLSEQQIRANAIMEVAAEKAQKVADAGGQATTKTQQLSAAWGELKDAAAARVELSAVITIVTKLIQQGTVGLGGGSAQEQMAALEGDLASRQARLAQLMSEPGYSPYKQGEIQTQTAQIKQIEDRIVSLSLEMKAAKQGAVDFWNVMHPPPEVAAALKVGPGFWTPPSRLNMGVAGPGGFGPESGRAIAEAAKPYALSVERDKAAIQRDAAADFKRRIESAADSFKGKIETALGQTTTNVKGLWPEKQPGEAGYELSRLIREGPFAPGAGGPTENLYRMVEAATAGYQGQWAAKLGVTPEYATEISKLAAAGQYTPEVMKWVDRDRLVQMAKEPGPGQTASQMLLDAAGKLQTGATDIQTSAQNLATGAAPVGAAATPITNNITLSIAAGAVQVVSSNATEVANNIIDAVFKALTSAENSLGLPARSFSPGAV